MYYHKIMSLRPMHVYKININSVAKFTSSRVQERERRFGEKQAK